MSRNFLRWPLLFVILTLVVAGCAPRTGGGETAAAAADGALVIDLPAIVIDFDDAGQASIGGVPAADLGAALGAPLDGLALSADQVQMFTAANIQHVQINNSATGLQILVNGQAIPSVAWDADSLATTNEVLAMFGEDGMGAIGDLLPLVSNLGAGVVLNFPLAQGAELIPTEVSSDASAAAQDAFLASAGSAARINLPINYNADGTFNIGNMSAEALSLSLGLPLESLTLTQDRIDRYVGMGMKTFTVASNTDGIHMTLNGQELPYISWGDGKLTHGLGLAAQAGLLGSSDDNSAMVDLIQQLLPMIQTAEVTVNVTFPQ